MAQERKDQETIQDQTGKQQGTAGNLQEPAQQDTALEQDAALEQQRKEAMTERD